MATIGEINPNVPTTVQVPDTYLFISTTPTTVTTAQPKNLFLLATGLLAGSALQGPPYSLGVGTATVNEIKQYSNVNNVNLAFIRRSPIANRFRSALQQQPIGINFFPAAIKEPDNSGFAGICTKIMTVIGTAQGSGQILARVCGFDARIPVANADTAATIAIDGKAALDSQIPDAPMVTTGLIGGTPTITIAVNATGSTFTITAAGVAKAVTIGAADTPTVAAAAIAAALHGDTTYPLDATSLSGVVTCIWRDGFPVSSVTISHTDTTQRYVLTFPDAATAGTIIPLTYVTRGADGNDSPTLVSIPPEITGVGISPAAITVTTTALGASGGSSLFTLQCDSTTYPVTMSIGTTPTQAAALIVAAINSTTGPLAASYRANVVTLFYRSGWYVKKLQMSSTEDTSGQTYRLLDRHDGGLPVITVGGAAATGTTLDVIANGVTKAVTISAANSIVQSATAIATALNGDATFPLDATSAGQIVYCSWRENPASVALSGTDATQTYALSYAASVTSVTTVAGNPALTGLTGAGSPTLTALLANKAKLSAMIEWACDYLDSTSTSAIYDHVELYGNGYYQQNQRVTFVSTDPLEVAKTVATDATPNLGNSWRYSVGVYQGGACQGGAYAAATAALLCATDLPFNMDSAKLAVGTLAPMLPGRAETDLDPASLDVALGSYHLFPFVGVNGAVTIVRGKTCWTESNTEWGNWSFGRLYDLIRFQLRVFLNTRFRGKVLFYGGGVIRVANGVRLVDIKNAIGEYLDAVDGILIDGAKNLKQFIAVEPIPSNLGFLRIYLRAAVPRELHVLSGVIGSI